MISSSYYQGQYVNNANSGVGYHHVVGTPFSVKDILNLAEQQVGSQFFPPADGAFPMDEPGYNGVGVSAYCGDSFPLDPFCDFYYGAYGGGKMAPDGYCDAEPPALSSAMTSPHVQQLSHLCPPYPDTTQALAGGGTAPALASDVDVVHSTTDSEYRTNFEAAIIA